MKHITELILRDFLREVQKDSADRLMKTRQLIESGVIPADDAEYEEKMQKIFETILREYIHRYLEDIKCH